MAELEITGTHAEQWGAALTALKRLWAKIDGNGSPGLESKVNGIDMRLVTIESGVKTAVSLMKWLVSLLIAVSTVAAAYIGFLEYRAAHGQGTIITPHRAEFYDPLEAHARKPLISNQQVTYQK